MPTETGPSAPSVVETLLPLVRERLGRTAGPSDRPVLVALDGRSGSGKTHLARTFAARLREEGHGCTVVPVEDLYPGWDGLAAALPVLCRDVLAPLAQGRPATYTPWDWHRMAWGEERTVTPSPVVLVEGVGALGAPCDPWDLRVWLEVPTELRRHRALARDGETFLPHWEHWATQEDRVLGPVGTHPQADVEVSLSGVLLRDEVRT